MRNHFPKQLLLPFILAGMAANHSVPAATYKWKDADGQVHYTQSPPPTGTTGETVKAPPKVDTDTAIEALKNKQDAFGKRLEDKAKSETKSNEESQKAAELAKYCDGLRKNLAGLQSAQRIYVGEGENRRRLGEDERQAKIKDAQEKLAKDCSSG